MRHGAAVLAGKQHLFVCTLHAHLFIALGDSGRGIPPEQGGGRLLENDREVDTSSFKASQYATRACSALQVRSGALGAGIRGPDGPGGAGTSIMRSDAFDQSAFVIFSGVRTASAECQGAEVRVHAA